jgi:iron complex outermembrane receptor protein
VFYYDFAKNQITSGVTFPNGQYVIFTQAVPTTAYGWENEISYAFARKTSLSGSVSYLHTRFTDFQAGSNAFLGNGIDFSGQALDSSPEFVAIGSLDHAFDVGNGAQLKLRAAIKSSSSYLISDFADAVRYRQPSFTRSDASLTYEASDNRYSLQLFVENIENKVQRTGGLVGYQNSGAPYGGSGSTTFTSLPANNLAFYTTTPRFYGLRLSARF